MARIILVLTAICLILGLWAPAPAQDERRAQEIIDAYRVWKLTDVLDLSEEVMPVFFSRIKKIGEAEAEQRRAEREAIVEIDHLLKGGAGEAELQRALSRYEEMRVAHWNEIQRLRDDAADMLTLKQRCHYVVFEERFRAEIRKIIEDVRSGRRGLEISPRQRGSSPERR